MKAKRLRVYNRARGDLLSLEIVVVDTTAEPLKKLIEDLAVEGGGIWLTPYRGIPTAPGLPPFDVVYLDENRRVAQAVESYPNPEFKPLSAQPASALVLPAHTVFGASVVTGDQLEFSAIEDPAMPGVPNKARASAPALQPAARKSDYKGPDSQNGQGKSLGARFMRWLSPKPAGRSERHSLPGLVAYHWTGGAPKAYRVGDISESGFYLVTEDRPFPGTIVLMTLQIESSDGEKPGNSIAVRTMVMRWGDDGVGYAFVFAMPAGQKNRAPSPENGADKKSMDEFIKRLNLPIA